MLPKVALVDPELTYDLPPGPTATTGMDALTQLIEPFLCSRANPLTDALCVEGIQRAARSLPVAFNDPRDQSARADMSVASLFGGLALANAGLGAVHGFAGPIGGMFPAPHGAVCAALLPHVLRANLDALRFRDAGNPALARFDTVARLLTGNPNAGADDAVDRCRSLAQSLNIPSLSAWGIAESDVEAIVSKAAKASSMKANPIALTAEELGKTLRAALEAGRRD
jgi:alcohol dehydrogenase class IV